MNKKIVFISASVFFLIVFAMLGIFVLPKRKYSFPINEDKLNIVIIGDSIFVNGIEGKDIGEYMAEDPDIDMQNYSIGGSTATDLNRGNEPDYYINGYCFRNLTDIIANGNSYRSNDNPKNVSVILKDAVVKAKYIGATDFSKVDVLIINYGINDGFNRIPASSDNPFDENTYAGTMRYGIDTIAKKYPNLKIILGEVIYTKRYVYDNGKKVAIDGNTDGWKDKYNAELEKIASEYGNVTLFKISDYIDVNESNYEEYLADGLHFKGEAKREYANRLAEYIRNNE